MSYNDLPKLDSNFINLLSKTLKKRLPPITSSEHLDDLINILMDSLNKGKIYTLLNSNKPSIELKGKGWPLDHLEALKASGWIQGQNSPMVLEGNLLSWRRWHEEMNNVLKHLKDKSNQAPHQIQKINKLTNNLKKSNLNEAQILAVEAVNNHNLILLSGGPGTGKTSTIVEMLLKVLTINKDLRIGLGAPTGKAARRLEETIQKSIIHLDDHQKHKLLDIPCTTLHRWLQANEGVFRKNEAAQLQLDILVVDEMSMVDLSLMQGLLKALPKDSQLILVGDPDQLPPIGNGAVWHKLHEQQTLKVFEKCAFRLTKVYRNRGKLADLANTIRDKDINEFFNELLKVKKSSSIGVISSNKKEIPPEIIKILKIHQAKLSELTRKTTPFLISDGTLSLNKKDAESANNLLKCLEELMVLCPRRYGPWSIDHIHKTILGNTLEKSILDWPAGTPVICGENQSELNLANGDLGIIVGEKENKYLLFRRQSSKTQSFHLIHPIRVKNISPAFAITVHKSQGSEADRVVFLWPDTINKTPSSDKNQLTNKDYERKLIYTAITRAKLNLDLAICSET